MFLSETGATRDAQPRFFCMYWKSWPSGLPITVENHGSPINIYAGRRPAPSCETTRVRIYTKVLHFYLHPSAHSIGFTFIRRIYFQPSSFSATYKKSASTLSFSLRAAGLFSRALEDTYVRGEDTRVPLGLRSLHHGG